METGLRYQGNKRKLVDWLFARMPKGECFIDLCGGGAAVSIAALRSRAYVSVLYNDVNNHLVNFFKVLRDNPEELAEAVDKTPYARQELFDCKSLDGDDIERARQFYVLQLQSFRAMGQTSTTWEFSPQNPGAKSWAKVPGKIQGLAQAIKGMDIENRDINKIIELYDRESTVFYADPPYVPATMKSASSYEHDMTVDDHRRMAQSLRQCAGNAAVSGYPSELYDELYEGWERHTLDHYTPLAKSGDGARTECLWIKRPAEDAQADLFA